MSVKTLILSTFRLNPGDLVTHMGDRELLSVSGRLLHNLGELAWMYVYSPWPDHLPYTSGIRPMNLASNQSVV